MASTIKDLLDLGERASLRVVPRADIGGVEIRVRGEAGPVVVVLAPIQAIELADRLVRAAFAAVDPAGADQ